MNRQRTSCLKLSRTSAETGWWPLAVGPWPLRTAPLRRPSAALSSCDERDEPEGIRRMDPLAPLDDELAADEPFRTALPTLFGDSPFRSHGRRPGVCKETRSIAKRTDQLFPKNISRFCFR